MPERSAGFQPAAHLPGSRTGSPNRVSDGDWVTRSAGSGNPEPGFLPFGARVFNPCLSSGFALFEGRIAG